MRPPAGWTRSMRAASSFGKRPSVARSRPAVEQRVDRGQDLLRAQVAVGAVVRQAVVGVLGDPLRAAAAEDLDAARAPDRRAPRARRRRGSRRRDPPPARARSGARAAGASGSDEGSQTSQQGPAGAGSERSPKWRRMPRRRQPSPSTHAHTERYWRQRTRVPSCVGGLADAPASLRSHMPTTRPDDAGPAPTAPAGSRPPARGSPTTARTASSSPSLASSLRCRLKRGGDALGRAHDRARRGLQQVLADRRALDEEDVQALVAPGGEQQAARRAARRAPRGRPPGSRPRSSSAPTRGRPSARRPCRRPCRTRWWRRRPAPRRP